MSKKAPKADAKRRVGIEEFLPAYLQAVKTGMTNEDFAASIGVAPMTVYQRVTKLRSSGIDIPHLAGQGRKSVQDKAAEILAQFQAEQSDADAE